MHYPHGAFSDNSATMLRRIYNLGWCCSVTILGTQGNMRQSLFKSAVLVRYIATFLDSLGSTCHAVYAPCTLYLNASR